MAVRAGAKTGTATIHGAAVFQATPSVQKPTSAHVCSIAVEAVAPKFVVTTNHALAAFVLTGANTGEPAVAVRQQMLIVVAQATITHPAIVAPEKLAVGKTQKSSHQAADVLQTSVMASATFPVLVTNS